MAATSRAPACIRPRVVLLVMVFPYKPKRLLSLADDDYLGGVVGHAGDADSAAAGGGCVGSRERLDAGPASVRTPQFVIRPVVPTDYHDLSRAIRQPGDRDVLTAHRRPIQT